MGGNVFSTNVRLPKKQAESIGTELIGCALLNSTNAWIIPSYRNKVDCGDIDILCSSKRIRAFHDAMVEHPSIVGHVENGDVTSYAYLLNDSGHTFQVDIISASQHEVHFAYNYFSYNDLGNFIGRYAHKMGVKFGHNGLKYVVRKGDTFLGEITLTTDFDEALEFLGFDVKRFHEGFDNLEDVFEYVASNPMYYGDIYNLQHMSHDARVRDKKRKSYQGLLKWIAEHPEKDTEFRFNPDKTVYQDVIFTKFSRSREAYVKLLEEYELKVQAHAAFNGEIVKEMTGLQGKELGELMGRIREYIKLNQGYNNGSFPEQVIKMHSTGTLIPAIEYCHKLMSMQKWFNILEREPQKWDDWKASRFGQEDFSIPCQLHLAHIQPELIKYLNWHDFPVHEQSELLEMHPEHCIIFI